MKADTASFGYKSCVLCGKMARYTFYEYMEKLPLDKTVEVHINGWIKYLVLLCAIR